MTITVELTPEEYAALRRRAEAEGTSVEAVLHGLIACLTSPPTPSAVPDDAEERAERDRSGRRFRRTSTAGARSRKRKEGRDKPYPPRRTREKAGSA